MRFSTIVAFMLPLTALAAPTLVERQNNDPVLERARVKFLNGFDSSKQALDVALGIATRLNLQNEVNTINTTRGARFQGELKRAVDRIVQSIDRNGVPADGEYVDTPHWFTIIDTPSAFAA